MHFFKAAKFNSQ